MLETIKNASWLSIGRVGGDVAGLIFFVVLSRNYGPVGIGDYAYGLAIATIISAIVNMGLEQYGIRELSIDSVLKKNELLGQLISLQIVLLLFVTVVLVIYLLITSLAITQIIIIALLCLQQVFLTLSKTCYIPAFAMRNMFLPAITELVLRVLSIIVALFLIIYLEVSLFLSLLPLVIGSLFLLIFSIVFASKVLDDIKIDICISKLVKIMRLAWPFAASVIVFAIYLRIDVLMISMIKGSEISGIYVTSLKFLEVALMPVVLFGMAAFPEISARYSAGTEEFWNLTKKYLKFSIMLGALITWGLLFIAPVVIPLFFGVEYFESVEIVKLIAIMGILVSMDIITVKYLFAMNLQINQVKIVVFGTCINIILNTILIPEFGIKGAIFSSILAQVVINGLFFRLMKNQLVNGRSILKMINSFVICVGVSGVGGILFLMQDYYWVAASVSLFLFIAMVFITKLYSLSDLKLRLNLFNQ